MKSRRAGAMMGSGGKSIASWNRIGLASFFMGAALLIIFKGGSRVPAAQHMTSDAGAIDAAQNATLGFGAIFIGVMPQ